jgi:hypothetical protein
VTVKLPEKVEMAIGEYLRLRPRLIVLSHGVAFVQARTGTDLQPSQIREAIVESAITRGRAVRFDCLTQGATRQAPAGG